MRQALSRACRINRRKIWICAVIIIGCLAGLAAHLLWSPSEPDLQHLGGYAALGGVAAVAVWLMARLASENAVMRAALARDEHQS